MRQNVKPTQEPVPSSNIKDLFFNSGLLDIWATSLEPRYIDRFGNCHLTAAGMEWLFKELVETFKVDMNTAIVAAGYITIDSFQQGADLPNNELTQRNHILRDETTGEYYRWDGELPKQVPAGSTPESTGGIGKGAWVSVGDASLRGNLRSEDGLSFIGETNYEGVRNYTGSNSKIGVYGVSNVFDGGDGTYLLDTSDTTSSDDGGIVIIDSLNRRWKRQYLGKVKAEWFGAKADGVTDSTIAIQNAINNQMNSPVEMSRGEYCISDTIRVKEFKSLEGVNDTIEAWSEKSSGTVIKWIGGTDPRKAMVLLGNNEVGAEPTIGSPAVCFRNVFLNGDYKVGFLAYGTYLSRDSIIDNIGGEGSTDYNFYFAKSWYATYTRIVSKNCKNNGVAFGMPLVYSDGGKVIWTSPAPLEMNRCKIDNIRSHSSGQRYSVDNPNTYNPKNDAMRMTGYGIGAGIGNSFSLTNFLSEQSGGVNLYYYTETQPVKVVDGGYLELSCLNSGLDPATELPNIIIDVSVGASNGGGQVLSNVFSNYGSGGIYTVRNGQVAKPIELINIHQPRFLKDIGNDNTIDSLNYPLKFVKLINTYYQLGYYNLLGASVSWLQFNINIRNGWSYAIPCSDTRDFFRVMFRNNAATWNPSGSITFTRPDGSTFSSSYPSTAAQGEWIDIRIIDNVEKISRSGSAGSVDQNIDIKIIRLPSSQL
ncbi:TPA: hypothetical protein U2I44_002152 [Providencia rettgeri]|nr:hypothetical protein [Providencia rettgeri]